MIQQPCNMFSCYLTEEMVWKLINGQRLCKNKLLHRHVLTLLPENLMGRCQNSARLLGVPEKIRHKYTSLFASCSE